MIFSSIIKKKNWKNWEKFLKPDWGKEKTFKKINFQTFFPSKKVKKSIKKESTNIQNSFFFKQRQHLQLMEKWDFIFLLWNVKCLDESGPASRPSKFERRGQWLWLSWLSSRLRHQRSALRTLSSENFISQVIYHLNSRKDEKEAGNGPSFKKSLDGGWRKHIWNNWWTEQHRGSACASYPAVPGLIPLTAG